MLMAGCGHFVPALTQDLGTLIIEEEFISKEVVVWRLMAQS
jgi:hypothetical protein